MTRVVDQMNQNKNDDENMDAVKAFGMFLPSIPSLTFRFGKVFFKFKRDAKKGGKEFRKELIRQGIDKKTAEGLTEKYLEASHIKNYIPNFR